MAVGRVPLFGFRGFKIRDHVNSLCTKLLHASNRRGDVCHLPAARLLMGSLGAVGGVLPQRSTQLVVGYQGALPSPFINTQDLLSSIIGRLRYFSQQVPSNHHNTWKAPLFITWCLFALFLCPQNTEHYSAHVLLQSWKVATRAAARVESVIAAAKAPALASSVKLHQGATCWQVPLQAVFWHVSQACSLPTRRPQLYMFFSPALQRGQ